MSQILAAAGENGGLSERPVSIHGIEIDPARRRVGGTGVGERDPAQTGGVVRVVFVLGSERQGGGADPQRGDTNGSHRHLG